MIRAGEPPSVDRQRAALRQTLGGVVALMARGHRVVLTHGNGPQVGHLLLRSEAGRHAEAYDVPLEVCVAQSQGEIGYLIQDTLEAALREVGIMDKPVAALLTRVLVDRADPAMSHPTKPIGPYYTATRAAELKGQGWSLIDVPGRGWRRVVPSPHPKRVLDEPAIRRLMEVGCVVVAGGGGGIPVCQGVDGRWQGVEAVVDKDWTSTLLATALGATRLVFLTDVEEVKLDFGKPTERSLSRLTLDEAKRYLAEGHFAPGSMEPKIESAITFLEAGGDEVVIATPEAMLDACAGSAGTRLRESFEEKRALREHVISSGAP